MPTKKKDTIPQTEVNPEVDEMLSTKEEHAAPDAAAAPQTDADSPPWRQPFG